MKIFVLLGLVAAAYAMPKQSPGAFCDIVAGAEALLRPGLDQEFDNMCVPQIQEQINECKPDNINSIAGQIAGELCQEFDQILTSAVNKLPSILNAIKQVLLQMLAPGGTFVRQCNVDLKVLLVNQLKQQCQGIGNLNAKQVCDEAFGELFDSLTYCGLNKAMKCPIPPNIQCE